MSFSLAACGHLLPAGQTTCHGCSSQIPQFPQIPQNSMYQPQFQPSMPTSAFQGLSMHTQQAQQASSHDFSGAIQLLNAAMNQGNNPPAQIQAPQQTTTNPFAFNAAMNQGTNPLPPYQAPQQSTTVPYALNAAMNQGTNPPPPYQAPQQSTTVPYALNAAMNQGTNPPPPYQAPQQSTTVPYALNAAMNQGTNPPPPYQAPQQSTIAAPFSFSVTPQPTTTAAPASQTGGYTPTYTIDPQTNTLKLVTPEGIQAPVSAPVLRFTPSNDTPQAAHLPYKPAPANPCPEPFAASLTQAIQQEGLNLRGIHGAGLAMQSVIGAPIRPAVSNIEPRRNSRATQCLPTMWEA